MGRAELFFNKTFGRETLVANMHPETSLSKLSKILVKNIKSIFENFPKISETTIASKRP